MALSLTKKALLLSYFTVAYNLLEGLVSVGAAWLAGSTALLGFGLDSFVESLSASIMIWRFSHPEEMAAAQRREKLAIRLVGATFLLLGGYVVYESIATLVEHQPPEKSLLGIAIAIVSLAVMPGLFYLKLRTARALGSRSFTADAKQTLACALLSVALLLGLGANYLFGLWQADPLAGLVIAAFLLREGYEALTEQALCC